jgi:hypothetical protein
VSMLRCHPLETTMSPVSSYRETAPGFAVNDPRTPSTETPGSGQLLTDGYGRSIGTLTALPYSVHEPS